MSNGPDIANALDDIADQLQGLADRAVPAANRIARVIHFSGVLGLIGGLLGAAALALPKFGFIESWGFFVCLVIIAVGCGAVVVRWSIMLRSWTGNVKHAVRRLHDVPSPGKIVDELRAGAAGLVRHGLPDSSRASVIALVRVATELRGRLVHLPGAADKAKDLFVELTGPFRPPMLGVRVALLCGGLLMVVVGPLLALIAAVT